MATAIQQLNARLSTTARDGDDDIRTRKRKTGTASAEHGEHAKTARAGRSSRHTGDRKARPVRRRSDEVCGLVVQTEIVPRSRGSAVLMKTESSSTPRLNANLWSEESALSTQMYYILVITTAGAALDKCHNAPRERRVRGLETVRVGMGAQTSDEVCGTPDERAGVQIPRRHSNKACTFERTVHAYENQSTKTVDDDIKIGDLIRNSVRITSWNQMRE